jgi:hypothetical protein
VLVSRGDSLTDIPVEDVQITFVLMTVVTLASCIYFARLAPDAAAEVSGHRRKDAAP